MYSKERSGKNRESVAASPLKDVNMAFYAPDITTH